MRREHARIELRAPPQVDAHALEQLVEGERLGDVVDRSCAQGGDFRLRVRAGAEHHHGQAGLQCDQLAQDRDPVAARKHHVEQHQRRFLARGARQGAIAIGDRLDGIALTGEPARHEAGNAALVLDDQDVHEDQTPSVFTTPRSHPKPARAEGSSPPMGGG